MIWNLIGRMKKNYDIHINPPKLSSEQIAKHKDFDALLKQFEATQPPKQSARVVRLKRFRFAAAAAVLLLFSVVAWQLFRPETNTISVRPAAPFINPPLEKLQKAYITFEVDAATGGVFEYGDGTKITVPPYAFVNGNGQLVLGKVFLMYREFHDYVDIFLSGIPMKYDSSSVQLDMATAGMMEMYALQNNQAVFLKSDNPIDIALLSKATLTQSLNYNVYQLDTVQQNWNYQQKDDIDLKLEQSTELQLRRVMAETEVVQKLTQVQRQINNLENKKQTALARIEETIPAPSEPIPPRQPNTANFAFDFDLSDYEVEGEEENELAQYKDILWEVSTDQETAYNKAISEIVWEDVKVEKIPNSYNYKVTLIHSTEQVTLITSPALRGSEYAQAKATYENRRRAYDAAVQQRNTQLQPQKAALIQALAKEEEQLTTEKAQFQQRYNRERIIQLRKLKTQVDTTINVEQAIINRFQVKKFGIWNCDEPRNAAKRTISATFTDEHGAAYINYLAFMVNQKTGAVQRFYSNKDMQLSFDENATYLLWLVNKEGKIAKFSGADFSQIPANATEYTFKFNTIEQTFNSEAELRAVLQ